MPAQITGTRENRKGAVMFVTAPTLAEATGLEPAIFGLTGRRVRPLHYASNAQNSTMHSFICQKARIIRLSSARAQPSSIGRVEEGVCVRS